MKLVLEDKTHFYQISHTVKTYAINTTHLIYQPINTNRFSIADIHLISIITQNLEIKAISQKIHLIKFHQMEVI